MIFCKTQVSKTISFYNCRNNFLSIHEGIIIAPASEGIIADNLQIMPWQEQGLLIRMDYRYEIRNIFAEYQFCKPLPPGVDLLSSLSRGHSWQILKYGHLW